MSIKCMDRVWETSSVGGSALLVLLAIADHAHDDGSGAFPSTATIARKTKLTTRQVVRLIHNLEAANELRVQRRAGPSRTNLYTVLSGLAPKPKAAANGQTCFMCGQPETPDVLFDTHERVPGDPQTALSLCSACHTKVHTLLDSDKMSPSPKQAAAEMVTPRVVDGDTQGQDGDTQGMPMVTPMSDDPSLTVPDPSVILGGVPPQSDLSPDDAWLADTRAPGESAVLTPGGIEGLAPEVRAGIATPAPETPAEPDREPWVDMLLRSRKRFTYQHGVNEQDVVAFVRRFYAGSGIRPPLTPAEAARWHAGATTSLYNAVTQFDGMGMTSPERVRHALWCVDLFFEDYSPLTFVTATSPFSLVNVIGRLAADLKQVKAAHNLPNRTLPTEEQARAFYVRQNGNGRTRAAPTPARPETPEAQAAMLQAALKPTAGGDPLTAARVTQ